MANDRMVVERIHRVPAPPIAPAGGSIVQPIGKKLKPGNAHLQRADDGEDCGGVKHGRVAREQSAHEFAGHV
jgi:hypothetical protein